MTEPQHATVRHVVGDDDTAAALGSGDLDVLATPRLVAWCEEATCAALDLPDEQTSVGVRVELQHRRASAVGTTVSARAEIVRRDDARVVFEVTAHDDHDALVARGEVERAVVDRADFLDRLPRR